MTMRAWMELDGRAVVFDAQRPVSLAIELNFDGHEPRWFAAPLARSDALQAGAFTGRVSRGASCNASTLSLTPHCDGTHTECVGHLTREACDVRDVAPTGLLSALLVSVTALSAADSGEDTSPSAPAGEGLITRQAVLRAWPDALPLTPRALVIRTLPNEPDKRMRDYGAQPAPYLSRQAATLLVERGIEHLVLDVPSADRADDGGEMCAHRVFFGLAPGQESLAAARRSQCTITELAFVADSLTDGPYLLQLQVPALAGEALPSRPVLFPLLRK